MRYRGIGQDPVSESAHRCAIPLEQLEKFGGWADHDSIPLLSGSFSFCERAPTGTLHAIFLSIDSILEQQGWSLSKSNFSVIIFFGIIGFVLPLIFYFTTYSVVKKILHKKYPKIIGAIVVVVFFIIIFFPWYF